MTQPIYQPPFNLKNGFLMTIYGALRASRTWEKTINLPEPPYQEVVFSGAGGVPIYGIIAKPKNPRGTIVSTYGITGTLENQWFLKLWGRKAFAAGYAVVLFDWRAHGKTAELSPSLTSDGLLEGEDFVRIAAQSKQIGCPTPFWFTGYSLGGQLALWGIKTAQTVNQWGIDLNLKDSDIAGGAVICPSLDSNRSLSYLVQHSWGKHLERAITKELKKLAKHLYQYHPNDIDLEAIKRANSIWGFDHELVIGRLGFKSVEEYYEASSGLQLIPQIHKPTLILYAEDDPLFEPAIIPELKDASHHNSAIDLVATQYGGHVGYISSKSCQSQFNDPDRWWAWNRILDWFNQQEQSLRTDENIKYNRRLS
ncbi:YheT family hydrolase [Planktothrix pseudagardhii]|uniref:Esterase slr0264 n=2 Tax=Planktothrix TaxID=54304 RepID=A0A9W4CK95_9CYAN|nr:alpha/beta fold hydrolase [Planktothrix pseudagardhii]CAD5923330.1 Putative esterase slr0264 [Planktothrix pseudagardhii]